MGTAGSHPTGASSLSTSMQYLYGHVYDPTSSDLLTTEAAGLLGIQEAAGYCFLEVGYDIQLKHGYWVEGDNHKRL